MTIKEIKEIEKQIVAVYQASIRKEDSEEKREAKIIIEQVNRYFKLLDVYTSGVDQALVNKLYFSRRNVVTHSIPRMSIEVFLSERSLYRYRYKYCKIIAIILAEHETK